MATANKALSILKSELAFLDRGGYHLTVGARQPLFCMESDANWRKPLFFEDSPSCPKHNYEECFPERDCVLMGYVPKAFRNETVPCRHIPLNEKGDTVESLTKSGRAVDVEPTIRTWLVKTIEEIQAS
jgi:hypothetical protein